MHSDSRLTHREPLYRPFQETAVYCHLSFCSESDASVAVNHNSKKCTCIALDYQHISQRMEKRSIDIVSESNHDTAVCLVLFSLFVYVQCPNEA